MIVHSRTKDYKVNFIPDINNLKDFINYEESFFLIDRKVFDIYKNDFQFISKEKLFLLDAKEENKTIETALKICDRLITFPDKRNMSLVVCGGGIVQDIGGFVANILYRGIKWILIPTTLLAASDSCIGGKNSLNYCKYKNILGTFFPPNEIFICTKFFHTLTKTDYNSGLGEIIKFSIILGKEKLSLLEDNIPQLIDRDEVIVKQFVKNSLDLKRKFIEEDEFDSGRRLLLNFGHTFGHAFECTSDFEIPHGLAVSLGILVANNISLKRNLITTEQQNIIFSLIKKIITIKLSKNWFELGKVVSVIKGDKKQINGQISAVLLLNDFNLKLYRDILETEIDEALKYVVQQFNLY